MGAVSTLVVLALAYVGLGLFALSQDRHARTLIGRPLASTAVPARLGGAGLLVLALGLGVASEGPAFGVLLWGVLLTVAGALVIVTLSWRARS